METTFMDTKNNKTNEPHAFVLNLPQILDLKSQTNMILFKIHQFITPRKISRKKIKTINSKQHLQHEMMNLNYLMVLMQFQIIKIMSSIS